MGIDWFTFIAQILNFLLLIYLLKRFLYKPLMDVMEEREKVIRERMEEADQKFARSLAKEQEFKDKLNDLERRAYQLSKEAEQEAERHKKELMHRYREEAEMREKQWIHALEERQEVFLSELYKRTNTALIGLLDQLIQELSGNELDRMIVSKVIESIEGLNSNGKSRALHAALDGGEGVIEVLSTFALNDKEKDITSAALKEALSAGINIRFRVTSKLGYGMEVRSNGWKIGWSTSSYLDLLREKTTGIFEQNLHAAEGDELKAGVITNEKN